MIICDVNILVAAFRSDHPHHRVATSWLDEIRSSPETLGITDAVITGFIRIVTNSHVFTVPADTSEAFDFIRALEASPAVKRIATSLDTQIFSAVCQDAQAAGNLVQDAYLAALAISLGSSIATFDRDFRKFSNLNLIQPA